MVTLYEHPLSPPAPKVKIARSETRVACDALTPDRFGGGAPA